MDDCSCGPNPGLFAHLHISVDHGSVTDEGATADTAVVGYERSVADPHASSYFRKLPENAARDHGVGENPGIFRDANAAGVIEVAELIARPHRLKTTRPNHSTGVDLRSVAHNTAVQNDGVRMDNSTRADNHILLRHKAFRVYLRRRRNYRWKISPIERSQLCKMIVHIPK